MAIIAGGRGELVMLKRQLPTQAAGGGADAEGDHDEDGEGGGGGGGAHETAANNAAGLGVLERYTGVKVRRRGGGATPRARFAEVTTQAQCTRWVWAPAGPSVFAAGGWRTQRLTAAVVVLLSAGRGTQRFTPRMLPCVARVAGACGLHDGRRDHGAQAAERRAEDAGGAGAHLRHPGARALAPAVSAATSPPAA